jgi:hypothetical protein
MPYEILNNRNHSFATRQSIRFYPFYLEKLNKERNFVNSPGQEMLTAVKRKDEAMHRV